MATKKIVEDFARLNCVCLLCRIPSALTHGVGRHCVDWFLLLQRHEQAHPCHHHVLNSTLRTIHAQLSPSSMILKRVCARIHPADHPHANDSHLYIHHRFQMAFTVEGVDAMQYLYQFMHMCDHFLNVSPFIWIQFVHILNNAFQRFTLCTHILVPVVWVALLTTLKLYDDVGFDNESFVRVINFACIQTGSKRQRPLAFYNDAYKNPYLECYLHFHPNHSIERQEFVTLAHFNELERLFTIDVMGFHLDSFHDRTVWPLITCFCQHRCQMFHLVYDECAKFMALFPCGTTAACIQPSKSFLSVEFMKYIQYLFLRLRIQIVGYSQAMNKQEATNNEEGGTKTEEIEMAFLPKSPTTKKGSPKREREEKNVPEQDSVKRVCS
jgi:hypothetical protein